MSEKNFPANQPINRGFEADTMPAVQNAQALSASPSNAQTSIEVARAIQEVQGAIVSAKKFPRDTLVAFKRIIDACKRQSLAKEAIYSFPRGGEVVSGPSIRLAEVLAQSWGNLDFGIRELSQKDGESEIMSFCWDLETNVRQTRIFTVKHEKFSKKGVRKLDDPRDVYENNANNGSRRLRACILGIIPGDVVDAAVEQCKRTLEAGDGASIQDRIRSAVLAFSELGITQENLEKRLGHKMETTIGKELVELQSIYKSLKDNVAKREDFFPELTPTQSVAAKEINELIPPKGTPAKPTSKES